MVSRLFKVLAVALLVFGLAFAASPAMAKKVKAAFVYVGPIGDHGWTYAHDQGRKMVEKKFGIETTYVESVMEADAERIITNLARRGYSPIFTTSFGYMDPTLAVAKKFPDTVFMHCSGFKRAPNVGTYMARFYQSRYLTGLIAGAMTKSNVIGYVNAFPIPECIRLISAFTIGVHEVNPKAKVHNVWINSWIDAAKGKEGAKALLAAGADVITQGIDFPSPQEAAAEAGKYFIGFDSDMGPLAPEATLTSTLNQWGVIYCDVVKRVMDGTWKSDDYYWGMDKGAADIAPYGKMVPQEVIDLVEKRKKEIIEGKFEVFAGPLKFQDGTEFVPKGKVATDGQILSMTKFVEGIVGSPK
jgi:basic membrane protein A